jgi:hypothetical protein
VERAASFSSTRLKQRRVKARWEDIIWSRGNVLSATLRQMFFQLASASKWHEVIALLVSFLLGRRSEGGEQWY